MKCVVLFCCEHRLLYITDSFNHILMKPEMYCVRVVGFWPLNFWLLVLDVWFLMFMHWCGFFWWYLFIDVSFLTTGGLYDFLNCYKCWYDTWKVNYHLYFLLERKILKLNKILGLLVVSIGWFYKQDTLFWDFCVKAGVATLISLAVDSRFSLELIIL